MSASWLIGTATSVVQTWSLLSLLRAMTDHNASLRADHSSAASSSSWANSNVLLLANFRTMAICSLTPSFVPANLKNRLGASVHERDVVPALSMHFICTSSKI